MEARELCNIVFFNDTATTEIYTLSLHDALPISSILLLSSSNSAHIDLDIRLNAHRSEEHTSELQSLAYLVCRLLLEKINIQLTNGEHGVAPRTRTPPGAHSAHE